MNVSLFYYKVYDLINQIKDPIDNLFQYQNGGLAESKGIEFEINFKALKNMGGYLRYSYQIAKDELGQKLVNSPENLIKIGTNYKFSGILILALEAQYDSKRITVYGTETKPTIYSTLYLNSDLNLEGFQFSFYVKNLFNESIELPGGYQMIQNTIPQLGRTYYINFTFGLNK